MPRKFLQDFRDGDAVDEIFLLADKQLRANRNAELYLLATLRDCTGVISGLMWNVTEQSVGHVQAGDYVKVRGKTQLYQGGLQMIVTSIRPIAADQVDPDDFRAQSGQDVQPMLDALGELLKSIEDAPLKAVMECFLVDDALMTDFSHAPAGVKAHHAYHGGLLEHVLNMLRAGDLISSLYPEINRDLLLAGIFLHDLGKVRELEFETNLAYTDEGQLIGHMVIAVELLSQKVREAEDATGEPVSQETVLRLKHMILSHHGKYEFGSPRLPMTPEAIALHHLDNLDAKVHEFARSIADDPDAGSHWTPYNPRIDRKLFKGMRQQTEAGPDASSPP